MRDTPVKKLSGCLEQAIMLSVIDLGYGAYGAYGIAVQAKLAENGRSLTPGGIYTALYRLEAAGLLSSRLGGKAPHRGGRRKRFYMATEAGMAAVAEARRAAKALWNREVG